MTDCKEYGTKWSLPKHLPGGIGKSHKQPNRINNMLALIRKMEAPERGQGMKLSVIHFSLNTLDTSINTATKYRFDLWQGKKRLPYPHIQGA
jgi:hypothetical protein